MYLNDKEGIIIGRFMDKSDEYEGKILTLKWKDGSLIQGIYDSYMEDETDCDLDDKNYEEFWSFIFSAVDLKGEPPVFITEDDFFCINYHNFPDIIMAGDIKIN